MTSNEQMSLLIKGVDMPKNGRVTVDLASEETGTNIIARITDDKTGKLIEHEGVVVIPTPHGRLIDADRLIVAIKNSVYANTFFRTPTLTMSQIEQLIEHQPTVIKKEEA